MNTELFHTHLLKLELEARYRRNKSYSLRSFARDLSCAPSWLSEVLNGKKGMSRKRAEVFAGKLGLNRKESELFILNALVAHSRKKIEKEISRNKIAELKENLHKNVSTEDLSLFNAWYYNVILELTELSDCQHQVGWFSKKLNLPLKIVSLAIDRLLNHGWLEFKNGKYRAVYVESETTFDVPSNQIKDLHRQHLARAEEALSEQDVKSREFLNMTMAFNSGEIKSAQKMIRDFQIQFAQKFYKKKKIMDSVYQLSIQLFRADKKESVL